MSPITRDRQPNSSDVAKLAGVSRATVSYVFNGRRDGAVVPDATRRRVMAVAEELGYRPNRAAQALKTGRTQTVALWAALVSTPFYATVLQHLQDQIEADGYELFITGSHRSDPLGMNALAVDGLLAVDKLTELNEFARRIAAGTAPGRRLPVVSMGPYYSAHFDHVGVDLYSGTREALEHLRSTGRRRFAYVVYEDVLAYSRPIFEGGRE